MATSELVHEDPLASYMQTVIYSKYLVYSINWTAGWSIPINVDRAKNVHLLPVFAISNTDDRDRNESELN